MTGKTNTGLLVPNHVVGDDDARNRIAELEDELEMAKLERDHAYLQAETVMNRQQSRVMAMVLRRKKRPRYRRRSPSPSLKRWGRIMHQRNISPDFFRGLTP